jgi:uncharacterized protein YegP (UPF0339 family)
MKFTVYRDHKGEYRWRLRGNNFEPIADSGEGYRHRGDCLHAIDLIKSSTSADVEDGIERLPSDTGEDL